MITDIVKVRGSGAVVEWGSGERLVSALGTWVFFSNRFGGVRSGVYVGFYRGNGYSIVHV